MSQEEDILAPITASDVDAFMAQREEYLSSLRAQVARGAGWKGAGKRASNNAMTDAVREREGTLRMTAKNIVIVKDDRTDQITVEYKAGRKRVQETHELYDLSKAEDFEPLTVLELASEYPGYYWSVYYNYDGEVERALSDMGLLQTGRRKRR
jgi:hypothetical protein